MVAAANPPNSEVRAALSLAPGAEPADGDDDTPAAPSAPVIPVGKLLLWIVVAAGMYGVSVVLGVLIARGIEAALGWSVP